MAKNLDFAGKLWAAADLLRNNMDPAEYKHVVLGLLFLKYINDAFSERQEQLRLAVADPKSEYYVDEDEREDEIEALLKDRDAYTAENVFWVPTEARWSKLQAEATQPTIGITIDAAMEVIEAENETQLKGVLPKIYALPNLNKEKLSELIDLMSGIGLGSKKQQDKDTLGRVYEYFLARFAGSEGKGGGEFYTPVSVVRLLVEMLEPYSGRVYDPCCGSGGMFVQSLKFIEAHNGQRDQITVYGQESNYTTWRLARMNMAIRGLEADIGHADTFHEDLHPDLRADYILANPPFNSDWAPSQLSADVRWSLGLAPKSNANFAWMQHILHHLAPFGSAGIILGNISLGSSNSSDRGIREKLIDDGYVSCIVNLPEKLFTNTPIGATLWILSKVQSEKVLFIEAKDLAITLDRNQNAILEETISKVSNIYKTWKSNDPMYKDIKGLCSSVELCQIRLKGYDLMPALYVGISIRETQISSPLDSLSATISELNEDINEVKIKCLNTEFTSQGTIDLTLGSSFDKISDILEIKKMPLGVATTSLPVISVTEQAGLVLQSSIFKEKVATDDASKYLIVEYGDVVFNPYLLWSGAIGSCEVVERGITSPAYKVFKVKEGFSHYLVAKLIRSEFMIKLYDGISIGTVPRRRAASVERFLDLTIPIKKEQLLETTPIATQIKHLQENRALLEKVTQKIDCLTSTLSSSLSSYEIISGKDVL